MGQTLQRKQSDGGFRVTAVSDDKGFLRHGDSEGLNFVLKHKG